MSDYLLKVKIQNNKIVRLMKERQIESVAELARHVKVSNTVLHELINMTASPLQSHNAMGKNGTHGDGLWREPVLKLADFFGVLPEEMFNRQQLTEPLKDNKAERVIEFEQMIALMGQKDSPLLEDSRLEDERLKIINDTLNTLTPREEIIIKKRFGLDGEDIATLDEVAKVFDVTRERIRQMEAKALRKLRHPKRAAFLKEIDTENVEHNKYDYKTNVTFILKDEEKEALEIAYKTNNYNWHKHSLVEKIHPASAQKYIDEICQREDVLRKIQQQEALKKHQEELSKKKSYLFLGRNIYHD